MVQIKLASGCDRVVEGAGCHLHQDVTGWWRGQAATSIRMWPGGGGGRLPPPSGCDGVVEGAGCHLHQDVTGWWRGQAATSIRMWRGGGGGRLPPPSGCDGVVEGAGCHLHQDVTGWWRGQAATWTPKKLQRNCRKLANLQYDFVHSNINVWQAKYLLLWNQIHVIHLKSCQKCVTIHQGCQIVSKPNLTVSY